jgi:hypothetical protein
VVIQTRQVDHPVLVALSEGTVDEYLRADTEMLRTLALPPFSSVAVLTADDEIPDGAVPDRPGVEWSRDGGGIVARGTDRAALLDFASEVRAKSGVRVRVAVNPARV